MDLTISLPKVDVLLLDCLVFVLNLTGHVASGQLRGSVAAAKIKLPGCSEPEKG
jgi:hypothetical protein